MSKKYTAFIGTNSVRSSRGIYTLSVDGDTGHMEITSTCGAYNTGAIVLSPDERYLYAASEGMTFRGKASGGAMAYEIMEDKSLRYINGTATLGQRPCCLCISADGKRLYAANFIRQSVAEMEIRDDGGLSGSVRRIGADDNEPRGGMHCVRLLDGGETVGAICMSARGYVEYERAGGREIDRISFTGPGGARHFTQGPDGTVYVLMQNPQEVHVVKRGPLRKIQTIKTIDPNRDNGPEMLCAASAIRITPDGRLLIAATRGAECLTVFRILDGGGLELLNIVYLPGETPRDFFISPDGRIAVTAMQASDRVIAHRINYEKGSLELMGDGIEIPSPAAVEIMR